MTGTVPVASAPGRGRLYSVSGTPGSGAKPAAPSSETSALRLSGELREHERLAGDRLGLRRKRVPREREHEQAGAGSRDAGRLANRPAELGGRPRQIPAAVGDHEVEAAAARGDLVHGRVHQVQTRHVLVPRARRGRREHGPREVQADHVPARPHQGNRVPRGAAAEIERPRRAPPLELGRGESQEDVVRGGLHEARHRGGLAPRRAGEGVHRSDHTRSAEPLRPRECGAARRSSC
jgi:hypothetical protein